MYYYYCYKYCYYLLSVVFQPETIQKCVDALRSDSLLSYSRVLNDNSDDGNNEFTGGCVIECVVHGCYSRVPDSVITV